MYNMSTAYRTAAEANDRQIYVKALFNGETVLTGENIIDMTVTEAVNASGGLSMGTTISSKLTMNIRMPSMPIILDGGFIAPAVGFYGYARDAELALSDDGILSAVVPFTLDNTGILYHPELIPHVANGVLAYAGVECCPLGKYYIAEATSKDDYQDQISLTAYDGFCKTEIKYAPKISMPNTAQAILSDIAEQCAFPLAGDITYPDGEFGLYDYTCRQYIGFFAGLVGKNARFNRDGSLTFVWYTSQDVAVSREYQYLSGMKRLNSTDFHVQSITSGSADNVLAAGSGTGISFDNPFMTQAILDSIFAMIGTFSFTPTNLKWRGNPAVEVGDIITAQDRDGNYHTVYVMEQLLKISGGFHSEIKCYGETDAAISFSTSPTSKKLQQVYNTLQEAIRNATELLKGSNGGVFEITDGNGDGINDGWIIHSADGQRFIKATVDGIGITTDGGATYQQAMTTEGINASVINTGQMNAQRITVGDAALGDVFLVEIDDDGHPIITIGSSENDIKQKQTNDAIEFVNSNNSIVAKFSVTGAEWEDMQQMKYCGFVWTKSATTGNVRFTKVGGEG